MYLPSLKWRNTGTQVRPTRRQTRSGSPPLGSAHQRRATAPRPDPRPELTFRGGRLSDPLGIAPEVRMPSSHTVFHAWGLANGRACDSARRGMRTCASPRVARPRSRARWRGWPEAEASWNYRSRRSVPSRATCSNLHVHVRVEQVRAGTRESPECSCARNYPGVHAGDVPYGTGLVRRCTTFFEQVVKSRPISRCGRLSDRFKSGGTGGGVRSGAVKSALNAHFEPKSSAIRHCGHQRGASAHLPQRLGVAVRYINRIASLATAHTTTCWLPSSRDCSMPGHQYADSVIGRLSHGRATRSTDGNPPGREWWAGDGAH
jgi:hypothetical protein